MRRHPRLAGGAHAVTLLRLGEDHRRLALVLERCRVRRVQLAQVVSAALQRIDLRERQVRDQRAQLRIEIEEVLLVVRAVVRAECLVLAVHRRREPAQQRVMHVTREQRIPVRAPQHLDHVPAGAREQRFELLDDLAVAAHRAVEPLQVAVDDERQVVQPLARGERQRAGRLRLVHLAVAEHAPDVALARRGDASMLEIAHEPRLVDRADRTDAHRAGRKLPEVRHQPRMRIRRQAFAGDFLPVVRELLLAQPAFEIRARVDARRRVRLEEHEIAAECIAGGAKEMVEADFEDLGGRRVARDVTAQLAVRLVRANDHRERVPANDRRQPFLEREVPGIRTLLLERDRVLVRGVRRHAGDDAHLLRLPLELLQQKEAALMPFGPHDALERVEPFTRFLWIAVLDLGAMRAGQRGQRSVPCGHGSLVDGKPKGGERYDFSKAGAPDRSRTCDLWLRKPTLYPTELRARTLYFTPCTDTAPPRVYPLRSRPV